MTDDVRLLDDTTNRAIVQLPGRRFPGLVLQGDTLHEMYRRAASADADDAKQLRDHLASLVDHYRQVLQDEGMTLPWPD